MATWLLGFYFLLQEKFDFFWAIRHSLMLPSTATSLLLQPSNPAAPHPPHPASHSVHVELPSSTQPSTSLRPSFETRSPFLVIPLVAPLLYFKVSAPYAANPLRFLLVAFSTLKPHLSFPAHTAPSVVAPPANTHKKTLHPQVGHPTLPAAFSCVLPFHT